MVRQRSLVPPAHQPAPAPAAIRQRLGGVECAAREVEHVAGAQVDLMGPAQSGHVLQDGPTHLRNTAGYLPDFGCFRTVYENALNSISNFSEQFQKLF